MMKKCSKCKLEFPKTLEFFGKRGKSLTGTCRVCKREKAKTYRESNRDRVNASSKKWRDSHRDRITVTQKVYYQDNKDKVSAYHKARYLANTEKINTANRAYRLANPEKTKARAKTYKETNKEKVAVSSKAYRDSNRDKVRAASLLWARNNPESGRAAKHKRRALMLDNEHTPYTEQESIELHGTDCHICLEPIDFNAPRQVGKPGWERGLHMDHVKPSSKSGANNIKNVKPSHGLCNLIKGNKEIYEIKMA